MKDLDSQLSKIKAKKSANPVLMSHVVLGYPTLKRSIELVRVMVDSGAAIIELQIPFSDPLADGPTIMMANQIALEQRTSVRDCFKAMETLQAKVNVPLLFMTYYNLVYSYRGSVEAFCRQASNSGAKGLIVPDIPPEESADHFIQSANANKLTVIPVISPLTSKPRMKIIQNSLTRKSFVYCVSVTGTTGARANLPTDLTRYLKTARTAFKQPLALGFGISSSKQIKAIGRSAEIAVVGSAIINVIQKSKPANQLKAVEKFIRRLNTARL